MPTSPFRSARLLAASLIALAVCLSPSATWADPEPEGLLPGHSHSGDVFDEGPRQRAYLMPGMPNIDFPITTQSPEAQTYFNQGVGQLHGFWYFEAERSFRQVAAIDPQCAMAYWGMAMANVENPKRAKGMIEKASQLKDSATPREQAWIEALATCQAAADNAERRRQYVRKLEAIVKDNPTDLEAKAFLALQIWVNGEMAEGNKRVPIANRQAVDAILDQIFAAEPMHPAHHYRIHLWDGEKRERALESAVLCGPSSPGVAHMWHMAGHIYSGLNRYADAAWYQEAAARVDHAQMIHDGVLPDQIHNYAHNNEWLVRDLNYIGRVHDAIDLAKNMLDLPRHPKFNRLDLDKSTSYLGRARLLDTLLQYECWADLIDLADSLLPSEKIDDKIRRDRLLGRAHAELGHAEQVAKQQAALEALLAEERTARYKAADDAEAKARADKKNEDEIAKRMADALKSHSATMQSIEQALTEIRAYAALQSGNTDTAKAEFARLKAKSNLRPYHLALALAKLGDFAEAEKQARSKGDGKGEVFPLATLTYVLAAAGKQTEAAKEFEKLRTLAGQADLDQPIFERLRPLAQELKLPDDWRIAPTKKETDKRPEIASLGPFRWRPSAAPLWSLPMPDGKSLTLKQYQGKPVLVLFYLGSGCLHCVEQVQKFSPLTRQFSNAGIEIVAITSETLDSLKTSLTTLGANEAINFPLAADADRSVFKAYRAYDDFEDQPLHGAYLIDGAGMIRWQDIGAEPFMDAKFLLEEAQRLLRQ